MKKVVKKLPELMFDAMQERIRRASAQPTPKSSSNEEKEGE